MYRQILTDDEEDKLITALARGQETFTEEDGAIVLNWARHTRLDSCLLDFVLQEKLLVSLNKDKELIFSRLPQRENQSGV